MQAYAHTDVLAIRPAPADEAVFSPELLLGEGAPLAAVLTEVIAEGDLNWRLARIEESLAPFTMREIVARLHAIIGTERGRLVFDRKRLGMRKAELVALSAQLVVIWS